MARGRMISNAITKDKRINQLMDDTSRLSYTWLITFADVEGRTPGDPAIVRSMLFPRHEDITTITVAKMEEYIKEWNNSGLIVWYEAKGDKWIYFPAFFDHNSVNKGREAESKIPAPPPELVMTNSGVTPDQLPVKLIKVKLNQVKLNEVNLIPENDDNLFKIYTDNIAPLTKIASDKLKLDEEEYGGVAVIDAIHKACEYNHRNLAYIEGILKNGKNGKSKKKSGSGHTSSEWHEEYLKHPELYGNDE